MATPTYSKYSFYTPKVAAPKKAAPPKVVVPYLSGGAGVYVDGNGFPTATPAGAPPPPSTPGVHQLPPAAGQGMPGSVHIPGWSPDYDALIAGDAGLIAAGADLNSYIGQAGDAKRAAIRQAVIRAGLVPPGAFGDIDDATIQAARENQWSTAAELERSRGRGVADNGANLAARGVLSSGGLTNGNQRVQEGFERGTTQATQALLDQIMGVESQTTEKIADARRQYSSLREQAAQRIANDPRYQPLLETDAVLDPESGLYMTSDGRWYTQSGQKVGAPVRGQTPAPAAGVPAPNVVAPPPPVTQFSNSRPTTNVPPGDWRAV